MTDMKLIPQPKSPVPRKLDDAMITALSDLVSKGNYYHDACSICDISEPAFYDWIKLAQQDETAGLTEGESPYIRLVKSLQKARAQARAEFVAVVREAALVKREWIPAVTYLERTDPEHWGRKDRTRVDVVQKKVFEIVYYDRKKIEDSI